MGAYNTWTRSTSPLNKSRYVQNIWTLRCMSAQRCFYLKHLKHLVRAGNVNCSCMRFQSLTHTHPSLEPHYVMLLISPARTSNTITLKQTDRNWIWERVYTHLSLVISVVVTVVQTCKEMKSAKSLVIIQKLQQKKRRSAPTSNAAPPPLLYTAVLGNLWAGEPQLRTFLWIYSVGDPFPFIAPSLSLSLTCQHSSITRLSADQRAGGRLKDRDVRERWKIKRESGESTDWRRWESSPLVFLCQNNTRKKHLEETAK